VRVAILDNLPLSVVDDTLLPAGHPHPWVTTLAFALARREGVQVDVVSMMGSITSDLEYKKGGVCFHFLKSTPIPLKILTAFESNKWKIHQYLKKLSPDIVHGQTMDRLIAYGFTCGYPSVATVHGTNVEHYKAHGIKGYQLTKAWQLYWEWRAMRQVRYAIAVSPQVLMELQREGLQARIWQIEHPLRLDFFQVDPRPVRPVVLFVGSVTPRKQVLELVKAVELVPGVLLRIIYQAANSKYLHSIKTYIGKCGLQKHVQFVTQLRPEALATEMSSCLTLVLPSKYESFGLVLAETMATGRPVIGSNIAGIPHVIKEGETGFLVAPGDIVGIAERLKLLFDQPDLATKMGRAAREEALRRWHPDSIAQQTMSVYEEVIRSWRNNSAG